MRAVTGSGLRTPVVPRFRGSWLRLVLPVPSWVIGTWSLPPQETTPARTRAPGPPRTMPRSLRLRHLSTPASQRFEHRPERSVPPFLGRIPARSGAAEPTPVDGRTSQPAPAAIHSVDDPAGPTHSVLQPPVPPVPPTPTAPSRPRGSGSSCPSPTHSGTHGPCGSVVADLVPSWAMPPAGPAVLVTVGSSGATADTPDDPR